MSLWAQSDGTTMVIWYKRFELGEGWSGPQRVEPENSASNPSNPIVAMDEGGNVLATWTVVAAVAVHATWSGAAGSMLYP